MESRDILSTETLFNAGVSTALEISYYVRLCGYYSFKGQYSEWYRALQIIERRMEKKFREKKQAKEELEKIHKGGIDFFKTYQRTIRDKRKLDYSILDNVKNYLSDYERSLLYWRDVFGYGMPEKEDHLKAAWK